MPTLLITLRSTSLWQVLLLILLYAVGQVISAIKWRILVDGVGIPSTLRSILRAYFFGMYVNTFGLGTVGGDVTRGVLLKPRKGKRAAALATVIADRVHGLTVLLVIGAIAILLVHPKVLGGGALPLAVILICTLVAGWWIGPKLLTLIFPETHRFGGTASAVAKAFPTHLTPFLKTTFLSLIFHSLQIYMHYMIAVDLNAPLTLAYLFATIPIVNIITTLPISINGLGVREALYIFMFTPMGVAKETAIAFGAIWIVAITVVSAMGGLFILLTEGDPELREITSPGGHEQNDENGYDSMKTETGREVANR